MNEQQKIEAEQLAKEEREAKEELRRKQVKLEKPTEDTSLVNGIPGDVNLWNRVFYWMNFGIRKCYGTQFWKFKFTKMAHDMVQWLALLNIVMNLWIPQKAGNFLISRVITSFSHDSALWN